MSIVSIYTNKCTGKAFAVECDKKIHLLTAAHVLDLSESNNNKVTAGTTSVKVLHKSTVDDLALLSAPRDLVPIRLADDDLDYESMETYSYKSNVQTSRISNQTVQGDSGSPVIVNDKCVAMIVGSCDESGCYVPASKINQFIKEYQTLAKLPNITIPKPITTIPKPSTTIPKPSIAIQLLKNSKSKNTTFCEI